MRCLLPLLLAMGCATPGVLQTPDGITEIRTARYRIGVRDGLPEIVVLLSNGYFECGIPRYDDAAAQEAALTSLGAAACREGAKHVALHLYRREDGWTGGYPGLTDASAEDLDEDHPRLARAAYYGVDEAFLVELDGLIRGYAAAKSTLLDGLGTGGLVQIDADTGDRLDGWFQFPDEGLAGEFRAERCTGDTSLIDVVTTAPTFYCE